MKLDSKLEPVDGYEVRVYFSSDDDAYIAVIDLLPGCAAEGETRDEALRHLCALKEEWIEQMQRLGHAIPRPTHTHSKLFA